MKPIKMALRKGQTTKDEIAAAYRTLANLINVGIPELKIQEGTQRAMYQELIRQSVYWTLQAMESERIRMKNRQFFQAVQETKKAEAGEESELDELFVKD